MLFENITDCINAEEKVMLYDLSGTLVYTSTSHFISVDTLSAGIYSLVYSNAQTSYLPIRITIIH